MTRAELIEAITEAAHPKFKMTKPSRRNGDAPTLYQQQLALVLAKRAKKDKTFSGRLKLIRAKIDNSLKGKSGGPHHPIFRWGESLEENQITVGRHDPRKLNKRLTSPTGGDSRFRPLPPRDKKPLQAPKQLGRRPMKEDVSRRSRRDITVGRYGTEVIPVGFGKSFTVPNQTAVRKALEHKQYKHTAAANTLKMRKDRVGTLDNRALNSLTTVLTHHFGRDSLAADPVSVSSLLHDPVHRAIGIDRTTNKKDYKTLSGNYRTFRKSELERIRQARPVTPTLIREDIINAIIEAEMSNVGGGGMTSSGKAGGNTRFSGAVSKGGSGGTVISNAGGAVTSSGSGKKLSGGFGTQGSGAGRFSGGGQKFGSRATAAAGVRDVGHGGSFGAPVGSKMSPGGPASRGQTTSAFTGGGSRPTGTASSTGGAQVQAKAPTPAPKAAATSNTGQSQNKTPTPAPKAASTSNSGQTQSNGFSAGEGTQRKVVGVGGGDKTQHNKRDLNPGNISQSQRQAGSNIMHNQQARNSNSGFSAGPGVQRKITGYGGGNTGGRFAGGGPRPMGGGGSYGGGSSWGHSQSGYRNTTNFNIGGSVGFGGGSTRGRIGANFGSSRMNYGSRSSGYYSGR